MTVGRLRMGKEEIFEIIVYDSDGTKLGRWKVMKSDFIETVRVICRKHGIKGSEREKSDLDWAM